MNERIKELAEQLEFPVGNENPQWAYELALYKFAELIIQECSQVCQRVTNNGMFDGNQQYASAYCRDEIKRHFGVE